MTSQDSFRDENSYIRNLGRALEDVSAWENEMSSNHTGWNPEPGSAFEGDNAATHPYEASHAAWAAIAAAVSHLSCLKRSIFTIEGPNHVSASLHTHGQFTLIRGALENASMAIWLMDSDCTERILRRLQQEWQEVKHLEEVRKILNSPKGQTESDRLRELQDLATKAGADIAKITNRPGYGAMVKSAGARVDTGAKPAHLVWKACSAIAHGEMGAMFAYLEVTPLADATPGGLVGRLTGNVQLLGTGGQIAVATTRVARQMFERQAGR